MMHLLDKQLSVSEERMFNYNDILWWKARLSSFRIRGTKNKFLASFVAIVIVLALVRLIFPSVAENKDTINKDLVKDNITVPEEKTDSARQQESVALRQDYLLEDSFMVSFFDGNGNIKKHRINSVPGFSNTFLDNNDVQLMAATHHGVKPVEDRADAEHRKKELVFVGASPYYHVDPLRSSIPYLIPRAAVLLNDIGRAYYDSLQIKGIPLHQIIVTSVLRSRADVKNLRRYNGNATENSCHMYGTTFDVCYNRYKTVQPSADQPRRAVRNDTLKWVLSEVLRDMRENKRCYIKYEVKQGCFHITVR